jgi:PIN like domain
LLVHHGWVVHLVTDHFPDDAQDVGDPEWIEYGLSRGWALLTQDERIRRQPAALALLRQYRGSIFCLSSAELLVGARAERFHAHQTVIYYRARSRHGGFYVVHEHRVVKHRR